MGPNPPVSVTLRLSFSAAEEFSISLSLSTSSTFIVVFRSSFSPHFSFEGIPDELSRQIRKQKVGDRES
ncbi:hypothetical protein QQP08_003804 [Theobroma cacao]|nr:hypothetical protein QQP08_003804 [Theobroma cacao]